MTCAATTTVIPAQAGTQTRIDERDACVEVLRSTAKRERFTTRTPNVTCLGPGLRRDDVSYMTVREMTSARNVCATGTRGAQP